MGQFRVMRVDTNPTRFWACQFRVDTKMTRTLFFLTLTRKKSYRVRVNSSCRNPYCHPLVIRVVCTYSTRFIYIYIYLPHVIFLICDICYRTIYMKTHPLSLHACIYVHRDICICWRIIYVTCFIIVVWDS